jgi:hypothetical protein
MVVGASNRADEAYNLALNATNVAPSQMTYVYTVSNTITLVSGTAGNAFFTTTTQDLAAVQIGHIFTTNLGLFATGSVVTAVDRTSGSNLVTFSGGGLLKSTNNASITITNAGSFTHTVPAGYSRCKVTVTGSGGTGGNNNDDPLHIASAAGGAGGTSIAYLRLPEGVTVAVTSGKRAATASAGNNGNSGNTSSFGSYATALGGAGGSAVDEESGGVGGISYGGSINISGGSGAGYTVTTKASLGGSSYWGGGSCAAQSARVPYGAGGGGADAGTASPGQAGDGIVVVEYY